MHREVSTLNKTLDHYLLHYSNTKENITYETNDGTVVYYADQLTSFNGQDLFVYCIKSKVLRQGTFKRFLQYIVDNPSIKQITIMAIDNYHLDEFLGRSQHLGQKWLIQGADRVWTRSG